MRLTILNFLYTSCLYRNGINNSWINYQIYHIITIIILSYQQIDMIITHKICNNNNLPILLYFYACSQE